MILRPFGPHSAGSKLLSVVIFGEALCFSGTVLGTVVTRDVTFFIDSDTHFDQDYDSTEATNGAVVASMNSLPGTAYPTGLGLGTVATGPKGVLVDGDLTNWDHQLEWTGKNAFGQHVRVGFTDDYPVLGGGTGTTIKYPVYEGYGNHNVADLGSYSPWPPQHRQRQ